MPLSSSFYGKPTGSTKGHVHCSEEYNYNCEGMDGEMTRSPFELQLLDLIYSTCLLRMHYAPGSVLGSRIWIKILTS